ncbi:PDZ domain-containing protein [Gloeobacter morelensis MG652769]|uniref:PDZ domain-containing protein n=1 Tax=Gloeobacter morelensis MG652769 TaxID=2781736 RepID=A0ABY3PKA2_9CYAN|nr:PDZ domain-containing protein [Gloeobacter morelensis MG652769]
MEANLDKPNDARPVRLRRHAVWAAAALASAALVGCSAEVLSSTAGPASKEVLTETWAYINNEYVDSKFNGQDWWSVRQAYLEKPAETTEQVYEQIASMLKTLDDPYTRFLNPKQFKSLQTTTSGELSGVGLQITLDTESELPVVIAAVEGSPAFRGGVKARDLIVEIDGQPTKGQALDDVADRLRGRIGSQVNVGLRRGDRTFDITLTRETIQVNPVASQLKRLDGRPIGYIRLSQFNGNAAQQVRQAIEKFEAQGVAGYILDLRSNPGGLLEAGVEIARYWLTPGQTVVYTVNRQGERDQARAQRAPLTAQPLVVLIDGGSASASEILAGALQDNRRAQLVGTKSFGKGLIQAIHPLKDGSGLAVSIARYQTPSRRDIHKQGIEPDVKVELPKSFSLEQLATDADSQYQAGAKVLSRALASSQ